MSNTITNLETFTNAAGRTFRVGEAFYLSVGEFNRPRVTIDEIHADAEPFGTWLIVSDCEENAWDVDPDTLSAYAR
jgi:hypothetical protein